MHGWLKWIPLFIISALFESITHVCLKKASNQNHEAEGLAYYGRILRSPIVWLGVAFYVTQIASWVWIAANLPISVAFPLSSVEKFIMVGMAVFVLRERLNWREVLSLILIGAGIICVTMSSPEGV